jgi:lactoylglutathione lyase
MLPLKGLYEIALKVKDLSRAEAFYKDVLGLQEGLRDDTQRRVFLYVGGNAGMVVLQEDQGEWPKQHFAFTVRESDLEHATSELKDRGVTVSAPLHHQWMNATSVYFEDPDGHDLELLARANS